MALFERGRFGVRPTPAGRLLYPEAKQALAALQHAQDVLIEHRDLASRALALAASHTIGEFLLPGWLASFRREQPGTRAQVNIVNSPGVLHALREREAQIGFVEGLDELDGFDSLIVHRDSIVVVVAGEHRWSRRRLIAAKDLAREPYITRELGSGTRAVANDALSRAEIDLAPTTETASLQSVKRALVSGGFSLLSRSRLKRKSAPARCARFLFATLICPGSCTRCTTAARGFPDLRGSSGPGFRATPPPAAEVSRG